MKIYSKNCCRERIDNFKNTRLASQNINQEFIHEEKDKINRTLIINKINKNSKSINKSNKIENKKDFKSIQKNSKYYTILILLIISNFPKLKCQNIITLNESIVTLKVSGNGQQKIFNRGTNPNKISIDGSERQFAGNTYNLNPTNIVKLKWTDTITDCQYMFQGCNTIIEINFFNFDSTHCKKISFMFKDCKSLKSLDLSGFITSNYTDDLCDMFNNCHSLTSLNLSNFDTSEVTSFGHMFTNCESLTSINISNFNTEKVQYLDNMFKGCKLLTSINLSNFITPNMINMDNMFEGCESLEFIDFSNLDVTSVTNIESVNNIFINCNNLEL